MHAASPAPETGPRRVYVIARDRRTFDAELDRLADRSGGFVACTSKSVTIGSKEYVYVSHSDALRGVRDVEIEFWPGSERRADYERCKVLAQAARRASAPTT